MKIVAFNGPPRSGKDAIAKGLMERNEAKHSIKVVRFADTLRMASLWLTGIDEEHYDAAKDLPVISSESYTLRQLMIDMSENVIKKNLGQDYWAKCLVSRLAMMPQHIALVTDLGFQLEIDLLAERFPGDVFLIQTERLGTSFANDSRSYVKPPRGVPCMALANNYALKDTILDLASWLKSYDVL